MMHEFSAYFVPRILHPVEMILSFDDDEDEQLEMRGDLGHREDVGEDIEEGDDKGDDEGDGRGGSRGRRGDRGGNGGRDGRRGGDGRGVGLVKGVVGERGRGGLEVGVGGVGQDRGA
ncbi:uncharacterized protein LOC131072770 [Cryptomeria japonica]|uniref:uncharacterized protein LOC131072770 n=1 Tax=Cryptomeria japonica TaxID=3369 RepID=UPI0025AD45A3|nr:uncharacterized protein LOC131072770 [Cryptomeria japonica]